jgi:hypothetical protein
MLELYDVVAINRNDEQRGLKKDQQGTIIDILANGEAYVVEFYDEDGNTVEDALFANYKPSDLYLVTSFKSISQQSNL